VCSAAGGTEDLDATTVTPALLQQMAGKVKDLVTRGEEEATERRTGATDPDAADSA
jgi:hypothetical protein